MKAGRPLRFQSVEEISEKIDNYFKEMEEKNRPLTMGGLAFYLEVDRGTLINYGKREEFFDTISRARQRIQLFAEESLYDKEKFKGAQFSLINNHGFSNKLEVNQELTLNTALDKQLIDGRRKVSESLNKSTSELLEEKKKELND